MIKVFNGNGNEGGGGGDRARISWKKGQRLPVVVSSQGQSLLLVPRPARWHPSKLQKSGIQVPQQCILVRQITKYHWLL